MSRSDNKDRFAKVSSNRGINKGHLAKPTAQTPGMLLSPQRDLSHTSILYYYRVIRQRNI